MPFFSISLISSPFFSLVVVTQIRGQTAGRLLSPLPATVRDLNFIATSFRPFLPSSTRVEFTISYKRKRKSNIYRKTPKHRLPYPRHRRTGWQGVLLGVHDKKQNDTSLPPCQKKNVGWYIFLCEIKFGHFFPLFYLVSVQYTPLFRSRK